MVAFLKENDASRVELQTTFLRRFPDIQKLYSKFYRVQAGLKHSATLVDCVKIYNMITTIQ